jgi:nitroreductase
MPTKQLKSMNKLIDLIKRNRSYRRFHQEKSISMDQLKGLVELARLSPSARNAQPIKYYLANTPELAAKIFPTLGWAGYLKNWPGPSEGERPSAYIVMLDDTSISDSYFCDDGIAAQSMLLGAVEQELGGCILGTVDRIKLSKALKLPGHLKIIQVLALGKPKETIVIEDVKDNNIKYWRDEDQTHHVPKRSLEELIIN